MGYSIGLGVHDRFIGYGVIAYCDHPKCNNEIDRGLAYLCGSLDEDGTGCSLYFCEDHLFFNNKSEQVCKRCRDKKVPFAPKTEHPTWIKWILIHPSWKEWRSTHSEKVIEFKNLDNIRIIKKVKNER